MRSEHADTPCAAMNGQQIVSYMRELGSVMDAQLGCDEPPSTVRRKRARDKAAGSLIQELHKSWGGKGYMERLDAVVAAQQIDETAGAAVAGGEVFKPLFLCAFSSKDGPDRHEGVTGGRQAESPGSRLHPQRASRSAAAARMSSATQPIKPVRGAAAVEFHAHKVTALPALGLTSTDPGSSSAAAGAPGYPGAMAVGTATCASDAQLLVDSMEQELAEVESEVIELKGYVQVLRQQICDAKFQVSQAQHDRDEQEQEVKRLEEQVQGQGLSGALREAYQHADNCLRTLQQQSATLEQPAA